MLNETSLHNYQYMFVGNILSRFNINEL